MCCLPVVECHVLFACSSCVMFFYGCFTFCFMCQAFSANKKNILDSLGAVPKVHGAGGKRDDEANTKGGGGKDKDEDKNRGKDKDKGKSKGETNKGKGEKNKGNKGGKGKKGEK